MYEARYQLRPLWTNFSKRQKKKKNKIHTEPNDAALILYVQHLMQHDIIINYA